MEYGVLRTGDLDTIAHIQYRVLGRLNIELNVFSLCQKWGMTRMPIASYWVTSRTRPELEGQEAAKSSKSISVSGQKQGLLSSLINETQLSIRGYGVLTASMHVHGVDPAVLQQKERRPSSSCPWSVCPPSPTSINR